MNNQNQKPRDPKDKRIEGLRYQVRQLQDDKFQLQKLLEQSERSLQNFRNVMAFYRGAILQGLDKTKLFCEQIPDYIYFEYTVKLYETIRDSYKTWNPIMKWLFKLELNSIISTYKTMIDEQQTGKKST